MANHDETTTPRPGSRMDLIQLQKYSDRAVSCPFADKIEDVYVYIYSHCYVYEGTMHNTCISVHGFINWITLTKRPPETREHPALRNETGHSKTTLLALFLLHFPSLPLLHPPPHTILFLSRRQDTGTDGRESRSPLSVPRAPTWPISTRHSSHVSNVQVKHRVSTDEALSSVSLAPSIVFSRLPSLIIPFPHPEFLEFHRDEFFRRARRNRIGTEEMARESERKKWIM